MGNHPFTMQLHLSRHGDALHEDQRRAIAMQR
jgi:hypothetical protein